MKCNRPTVRCLLPLVAMLVLVSVLPAYAGPPCCEVVGINARTGVVTAKVNATGQQFAFRLNNTSQINSVRVGQGVYANLAARQVSLDGRTPSGTITSIVPARSQGPSSQPAPAAPLDGVRITSIDSAQGKVSVQVLATGDQIYFNIPNSSIQAHNLAVGQTMAFASLRGLQAGGTCPCGQHTDGTCACACGVPACEVACKFGECRNGVQGPGSGGVATQTSGGTGVHLAAPLDGFRPPAAQVGRFTVATIQGGYAFRNLSPRLQSILPNGAKLQITVDNPKAGKSTITGVVTKVAGGFQVKTPERLTVSLPGSWLLIRGLGNRGTGEPPCGGCPRDAGMDIFEGDPAVCFCFAGTRPSGGVLKPMSRSQAGSSCSGALSVAPNR